LGGGGWGRADFAYSSQAREVDNFLYEHEFFTVGNYGACVHAAYCGSFNSVVTPASAKNTIAVGATKSTYSSFPSYIDRLTWNIKIKGRDSLHWEHHLIRGISANFALNHPVETKDVLLYPGYACDDSYTTNVTGKIVLVQRGECSFVQKAINVQKAGASALIVMNNETCRFILMQGDTTEVRIPVLNIPQKDANLIVALLAANLSTSLQISGPVNYPSEKWEHLEDWSSGGPTAEGRIKPDVVAPGGYIKSAARVTNEQFIAGETCQETYMSGTSMACPLAAGSMALIRQYFTEGF
jgi:subtilisin family serine protease